METTKPEVLYYMRINNGKFEWPEPKKMQFYIATTGNYRDRNLECYIDPDGRVGHLQYPLLEMKYHRLYGFTLSYATSSKEGMDKFMQDGESMYEKLVSVYAESLFVNGKILL